MKSRFAYSTLTALLMYGAYCFGEALTIKEANSAMQDAGRYINRAEAIIALYQKNVEDAMAIAREAAKQRDEAVAAATSWMNEAMRLKSERHP